MKDGNIKFNRRSMIKKTGKFIWLTPIVSIVQLPTHAQTSVPPSGESPLCTGPINFLLNGSEYGIDAETCTLTSDLDTYGIYPLPEPGFGYEVMFHDELGTRYTGIIPYGGSRDISLDLRDTANRRWTGNITISVGIDESIEFAGILSLS